MVPVAVAVSGEIAQAVVLGVFLAVWFGLWGAGLYVLTRKVNAFIDRRRDRAIARLEERWAEEDE